MATSKQGKTTVKVAKRVKASTTLSPRKAARPEHHVADVVAELRRLSSKKTKDGMARYGIPSHNAFGVPVGVMRALGKRLGKSHALAEALWKTGHYEARMLATFVDEPERVTPSQMDRWCKEFDSWAICDTACFALFDRTPHAFARVKAWAKSREELVKRAAFALLASLTVHDRTATEDAFLDTLPLIEKAALDSRNFVKKSVNWALRSIGKRSPRLNRAAIEVCQRLAQLTDPAPRWVGKDALRELQSASVKRRLTQRERS